MEPGALLEALLELADRADLEVRTTESAACRVGERIWVVLAPGDPTYHQASVLAAALGRFRADFLEDTFVPPGVREFLDLAATD
jgi:hypothetical protein